MRKIIVPKGSALTESDYAAFLTESFGLLGRHAMYFAQSEGIDSVELAHLIPSVPETVLAIYIGINDAVCNKGLVAKFLVRHGHNNVFVFDPQAYSGKSDVPAGTIDASSVLSGFRPPNSSWNPAWTYVMIQDPSRTFESLWHERGYIDMIPAKFEDFTMLSDPAKSKLCVFVDPKAFDHSVNQGRPYLKASRDRGAKMVSEFIIPSQLEGETQGLVPVVLNKGEKLYIARPDFGPCAHAWCNIHPANTELAVVNENSAVPLNLVISKPPVNKQFAQGLIPPKGSSDMTTDWFFRGTKIMREPILQGLFQG